MIISVTSKPSLSFLYVLYFMVLTSILSLFYLELTGISREQYVVGLVEKADTPIFRWRSWHVDFSLEKPTRRFSVQKADTSIFGWKSGHVDFSWKRAHFWPEFKLILFELRSTDTGEIIWLALNFIYMYFLIWFLQLYIYQTDLF